MYNIINFNEEELKKWMKENGEQPFRSKQVINWIYKGITSFDEMKNVSSKTQENLANNFYIGTPTIVRKLVSTIDGTIKYLMKLHDGNIIECVLMKYKHGNSICISSQVGCRMGCTFCASTIGGRVRNLDSGEMLGQIIAVSKDINERISNVVMMGSGEPLDNYDNVLKFLEEVGKEYGLNIGARHITLSTCGIVPEILELSEKGLQITLAISLHASNDEIRKKSMPIANKYTIKEVIEACKQYICKTKRRVTFEYALIEGLNDEKEHAEELATLLKGMLCHVNLIPINEVKESGYKKPDKKRIDSFKSILEKNKIETTVRREMGADINAACGQLRRDYVNE
ncbi:23S rRNA (adenine(2503)-C(2))-methyltransferase RlmN [Oceanirhabdus seepicola]|uniref:Probable dual-specificity RNA methyltransferase RlmN n=1 Tax=Oceanirhabdus seepicola TaxID=2828781 RepID=A0A9J6P349_9CLOT|nr:23S rRNA (adenine(2503)-C(2))-methyltransferase RlmN [Oceanirhabdus seepicola]MCM1991063.1 23S rRNA (adenine(2503)-C(2))-methyltransferase RlmN [Oceanirhabdus seepicola]